MPLTFHSLTADKNLIRVVVLFCLKSQNSMLLLQIIVVSFKFVDSLKSKFILRLQAFSHSGCCYFSASLIVLDSGSQEDPACADEPLLPLRRGRRTLCVLGVWLPVSARGHVGSSGEGGLSGVWP